MFRSAEPLTTLSLFLPSKRTHAQSVFQEDTKKENKKPRKSDAAAAEAEPVAAENGSGSPAIAPTPAAEPEAEAKAEAEAGAPKEDAAAAAEVEEERPALRLAPKRPADLADGEAKPAKKKKSLSPQAFPTRPVYSYSEAPEAKPGRKKKAAAAPSKAKKAGTGRPRGRPRKHPVAEQTPQQPPKKRGRPKKSAAKPAPAPVVVLDTPQAPAFAEDESEFMSDDQTVSMQATPEAVLQKNWRAAAGGKPRRGRPAAAEKATHRHGDFARSLYPREEEAATPVSNLRRQLDGAAVGGLSRTIVEHFGGNTSESSVLKDLLEQYNEVKTKYQELKVSIGRPISPLSFFTSFQPQLSAHHFLLSGPQTIF